MTQDVLKQHKGMLALTRWQGNKARRDLGRNVHDGKIGMRQALHNGWPEKPPRKVNGWLDTGKAGSMASGVTIG